MISRRLCACVALICSSLLTTLLLVNPANADDEEGEPVGLDALAYAQFRDLSVTEAKEHLRLQGSAESTALALEQNASVTAFWIDTSGSWQFIVGVRDADAWPAIQSSLPAELQEHSSMVLQEHSDEELATYAAELQEAATEAGLEASASVDATRETVRMTIATAANDAELRTLQASQEALGEAIEVEVVVNPDGIPKPALLYGGIDAATCTMGFSVTNGAVRGLTTAAHCPEPAAVWGLSLPMMKAWFDASHDIQWHAGIQNYTNLMYDGEGTDPTRRITAQISRYNLVINGTYCKRGKTTGYSCGSLTSKTEPRPPYVPAGTSNTWLAIDGGSCSPGDSGGPIFIGSSAAGFLSGCAGTRVIGMSLDGLSGTGLTILKVP